MFRLIRLDENTFNHLFLGESATWPAWAPSPTRAHSVFPQVFNGLQTLAVRLADERHIVSQPPTHRMVVDPILAAH